MPRLNVSRFSISDLGLWVRVRLADASAAVRNDRTVAAAAAAVFVLVALAVSLVVASLLKSDRIDDVAEAPVVIAVQSSQPEARYYARVEGGVVTDLVVADEQQIFERPDLFPGRWIETFPDGSERGVYAAVGYLYDSVEDVFYPPQPFPSWTLSDGHVWLPPVPRPSEGRWLWDESSLSWVPRSPAG